MGRTVGSSVTTSSPCRSRVSSPGSPRLSARASKTPRIWTALDHDFLPSVCSSSSTSLNPYYTKGTDAHGIYAVVEKCSQLSDTCFVSHPGYPLSPRLRIAGHSNSQWKPRTTSSAATANDPAFLGNSIGCPQNPQQEEGTRQICVLSLAYRSDGFVTMLVPLLPHLCLKNPSLAPLCSIKKLYFYQLSAEVEPGRPGFEETRWIVSEDVNPDVCSTYRATPGLFQY